MLRPILCSFALVLLAGPALLSQDTDYREDLRFAELLRARGDNDLALELLQKIGKTAPPEIARELPLEYAKTRLRVASDEPETARRLHMYRESRADFQKFIDANPGHARLAEANLDVARVLNLVGKTELNQALLTEDLKTKKEIAGQARATLVDAAGRLQAAESALDSELGKLPDPDTMTDAKKKKEAQAARTRVEEELEQTKLERALNLYDQASTYLGGSDELASGLLVKAEKLLNPLVGGAVTHPITWKARAWRGRILHQIKSADAARAVYQEVIAGGDLPAAAEGVRLARYFRMLVMQAQPNDEDKKYKGTGTGPAWRIIDSATDWRKRYPQQLWKTPEGCGVTFLLAQTYSALGDASKNPVDRQNYFSRVQNLARELETSENEFTERARRLKIQAIIKQGGFSRPIKSLRTFEDCFVRAQYEMYQLAQEMKDAKTDKEAETKRKARMANILEALKQGLSRPDARKMKTGMELNTARGQLAYWALSNGDLETAIEAGERFARDDPRSSQAAMSAVYALQAYTRLLAGKDRFEAADDRTKMFSLARYMQERWPGELAGELAAHLMAAQLVREENYPEAIKMLSQIRPTYGNYTQVLWLLADAASKAEKASLDPIPGDRVGDYRKRAVLAWEKMPESALGSDPFTNYVHVHCKGLLGAELFRYGRYTQMDELAGRLLDRLATLRFHEENDKDIAVRNQLRFELTHIKLYARYGLATNALDAGDFAKAAELLDPVVDQAAKAEETQEKVNLQKTPDLAQRLLATALRANLQLGKIDRTEKVLDVLNKVSEDGAAAGSTQILRLLASLIRTQVEEVRKKGDMDELKKAIKGYSAILDKQIAKQKGDLKPDFIRVLADCYGSMGEHGKAATELAKVPDPRAKPGSDEDRAYRGVQIALLRELRLSKTPANLKKARALLDQIRGPDKAKTKPGWGRTDLGARREHGKLLEAEEKWTEAFREWATLVKILARQAGKGGQVKENYLECYYHMVYCYVKLGEAKVGKEEKDKFLRQAAQQVVQLERSWGEDFGSEASRKRFDELFAQEPALKLAYEGLRKKK